jgi:aspartyl protease family protein
LEQAPHVLYLVLAIVLVLSSLVGSQITAGKAVRYGLIWVAIFAGIFTLVVFRGEFGALGTRLKSELTGSAEPLVSGETLRLTKRDDGHFWIDAKVNGAPVRFLVDSGATTTTISAATAEQAGLEAGMRGDVVETANGTIFMPRVTASLVEIGGIRRSDLSVNINSAGETSVLGMNFLSSLSSWGVQGDVMVLTP